MANSAAVLRLRESVKYSVLPSLVSPPGPVVSESSNGTSSNLLQPPLPSAASTSWPPSGRARVAKRRL